MNFQPPEDPGHDEFVREQQAQAQWNKQLTDAYAEGRVDGGEEPLAALKELIACKEMHEDYLRRKQRRANSHFHNPEAARELQAQHEAWKTRQARAWEAARAVIAKP